MPNAPACSCHSNREMTNKPFDGLFEFEQASGLVNQFLLSSFIKVTFKKNCARVGGGKIDRIKKYKNL